MRFKLRVKSQSGHIFYFKTEEVIFTLFFVFSPNCVCLQTALVFTLNLALKELTFHTRVRLLPLEQEYYG